MDAIITLIGGLLILGSIYLSIILQHEHTQTMGSMSYNSKTIDCQHWIDILAGKKENSRAERVCTLPALIHHQLGDQTIEDLLTSLAQPMSEGDYQ